MVRGIIHVARNPGHFYFYGCLFGGYQVGGCNTLYLGRGGARGVNICFLSSSPVSPAGLLSKDGERLLKEFPFLWRNVSDKGGI